MNLLEYSEDLYDNFSYPKNQNKKPDLMTLNSVEKFDREAYI